MSFSFGAPVSAPAAAPAPSLFGNTAAAPTLFGAPATTTAPAPSLFGATAAPTLFGATATTTAAPSLFGATATTAAPSLFGSTATTAAPSLFGAPATSTAAPTLFGATASTAAAPTLGFGVAATTTTASTLFGTTAAAAPTTAVAPAAAPVKIGLGGVNPETSRAGAATPTTSGPGTDAAKTTEQLSIKEQEIPASLKVEVAAFKDHVKRVKGVRENIARFSAKPFYKVLEEVNGMNKLLSELGNTLVKNVTTTEKLRLDTHRELKNAEIAARTRDTPPGLQYENVAPMGYFQYMVDDFEARMQTYRQQIEQLESYLAASTGAQAAPLTPQTLAALIQQIQDSFMEIAGQLQVVHEKIQTQKEHYLNYRRFILDDDTDVFAPVGPKIPKTTALTGRSTLSATGPSPFSSSFAQKSSMASIYAALQATQTPAVQPPAPAGVMPFGAPSAAVGGAPPTLPLGAAGPTPFGTVGFAAPSTLGAASTSTGFGTTTGFGLPNLSQTSFNSAGTLFGASPNPGGLFGTPATQPLTLAKPPMGNKRGKR